MTCSRDSSPSHQAFTMRLLVSCTRSGSRSASSFFRNSGPNSAAMALSSLSGTDIDEQPQIVADLRERLVEAARLPVHQGDVEPRHGAHLGDVMAHGADA